MTMGRPDSTELMKWLPWETIRIEKKGTKNKVNLIISDTSIFKRVK